MHNYIHTHGPHTYIKKLDISAFIWPIIWTYIKRWIKYMGGNINEHDTFFNFISKWGRESTQVVPCGVVTRKGKIPTLCWQDSKQTDLCSVNITPNPSSYNNNKIVQNFQIASQNEDIFLGSFTSYNLPPPEKKRTANMIAITRLYLLDGLKTNIA